MRELRRAAWWAYVLWLAHNVHEWEAGMAEHLREQGFLGLFLGHRAAYAWMIALMQAGALLMLLLAERLPKRRARWALGALVGLIAVGVLDHTVSRLPGWQSALALGVPTAVLWARAWRRSGGSSVGLVGLLGASALLYLPFALVHVQLALALDGSTLPTDLAHQIRVFSLSVGGAVAVARLWALRGSPRRQRPSSALPASPRPRQARETR